MSTWKIHKGADALFEGTVLFSTLAGTFQHRYDLTDATLTWKLGSTWGVPSIYTRPSVGGTNWTLGTTVGSWTFEISSADSSALTATNYFFTIWLKTALGREYAIENGTLQVRPTVGTV